MMLNPRTEFRSARRRPSDTCGYPAWVVTRAEVAREMNAWIKNERQDTPEYWGNRPLFTADDDRLTDEVIQRFVDKLGANLDALSGRSDGFADCWGDAAIEVLTAAALGLFP